MDVLIIIQPITRDKLKQIASERFGDLVKAVVDIEVKIMALGGELHADEEAALLEQGSEQKNLWGINLYPGITNENFIEFDSMINLRPSQNNKSRGVDNAEIREKIMDVVKNLIQ